MDIERETIGITSISDSSPWSVHSFESNQVLSASSNQLENPPVSGLCEDEEEDLGTVSVIKNGQKKKRKYVKKSILKFLKSENKIIHHKSKDEIFSNNKVILTPIYNHLAEKIDFVLIGGDLFFKFDLNEEEIVSFMEFSQNQLSIESDEESQNQVKLFQQIPTIMNQYKEIVEVQKHEQYIILQMSNKIDGLKEFQNLISKLNEATQQLLGEPCLNPLIELQKIMTGCMHIIQGIQKFYENDTEKLIAKQQKRIQYIEKQVKNKILQRTILQNSPTDNDYHQDIYTVGFINIDFQQQIPVLRKALYSKEYISMMGLSLDESVNFFIRQGIKECYDLQTRMRIQQAYIKSVLAHNQSKTPIQIEDIRLLTFDNITLHCKGEISLLNLEIPSHLRYNESNVNEQFLEQAYIMKIKIPIKLSGQIQKMRDIVKNNQKNLESSNLEQDEFRYSIQSQVFIEKFYQNPEQQNQNIDIEEDQIENNGLQNQNKPKIEQPQSYSEQYFDDQSDSRCRFKAV